MHDADQAPKHVGGLDMIDPKVPMDPCPLKPGLWCSHTPDIIIASRCLSCPWLVNNPWDAFGRSYGYKFDLVQKASKSTTCPCIPLSLERDPTEKHHLPVARGNWCFLSVGNGVEEARQ